ncbi:type II secretion system protein [soil metagenome]
MKTTGLTARLQLGFTLLEAIVVMAITGTLAAVVAVFIRTPVEEYFESARRAEMTDTADTAARRIARDLRSALPNSVRVTGATNNVLEFLSTHDGGRYRVNFGDAGVENTLDFANAADTSFEILGPAVDFLANDQIVIYNLPEAGADAYTGNNRRAYTGAVGPQSVASIAAGGFPYDSPTHRFQVVSGPVTYFCDPATGILWRYWGYAIQANQTSVDTLAELDGLIAPPNATRGRARLAQNVNCTLSVFEYRPGVSQTTALVTIRLGITQANETISLYHTVHVNNVP